MRGIIFLTFCMFAMLFPSFPYAEEEIDYEGYVFTSNKDVARGYIWDLPMALVLESEPATFLEQEEQTLFYLTYIYGRRHLISYGFDKGSRLSRIQISDETPAKDPQGWIDRLMDWQANLTERYGLPAKEEFLWRDDLEINTPKYWGNAVARQELIIMVQWETPHGPVSLKLEAPDLFEPVLTARFDRPTESATTMEPPRLNLDLESTENL
jgi:hypothetical protein